MKKVKTNLTDERSYFRPFNYPWAYDAWLKHEQSHWMHTEVLKIINKVYRKDFYETLFLSDTTYLLR